MSQKLVEPNLTVGENTVEQDIKVGGGISVAVNLHEDPTLEVWVYAGGGAHRLWSMEI